MQDIALLNEVELLDGVTLPDLALVAQLCRADKCIQGARISSEGQPAGELFLLKEGGVELRYELPGRESSGDHALSTLRPGDAWGWSALVPPHVYTLSAYCTAPQCAFLRLKRQDLEDLFIREPGLGYIFMRNLARIIGRRFNAAQDELARQQGFDQMHRW